MRVRPEWVEVCGPISLRDPPHTPPWRVGGTAQDREPGKLPSSVGPGASRDSRTCPWPSRHPRPDVSHEAPRPRCSSLLVWEPHSRWPGVCATRESGSSLGPWLSAHTFNSTAHGGVIRGGARAPNARGHRLQLKGTQRPLSANALVLSRLWSLLWPPTRPTSFAGRGSAGSSYCPETEQEGQLQGQLSIPTPPGCTGPQGHRHRPVCVRTDALWGAQGLLQDRICIRYSEQLKKQSSREISAARQADPGRRGGMWVAGSAGRNLQFPLRPGVLRSSPLVGTALSPK